MATLIIRNPSQWTIAEIKEMRMNIRVVVIY